MNKKMEGGVIVMSRETVKPSSQLENHLKKVKRSYLDQLVPATYVPIIFFYETTPNHLKISQHLKHTLSHALTSFYPLAGRVNDADNTVVDCNDAGVEFIDARIHARLTDVLRAADMEDRLKQYLPIDPTSCGICTSHSPSMLVQITFFDCGAIALGICFSHLITDCKSFMMFMNAWASNGATELATFDLANYFPAKELPPLDVMESSLSGKQFKTRRLVFDKETLAALKKEATATVKDPTRVEVATAFIWKHILEVAREKNPESRSKVGATHAVNLRGRKMPCGVLENVFGNCFMNSLALSDVDVDLVAELRRSIRQIEDGYITRSQKGDDYLNHLFPLVLDVLTERKIVQDYIVFTSWCGFGVYDVDYGFGTPAWVCTTAVPLKNTVFFIKTKDGDLIEAWVNMEQHNFQMLHNKLKDAQSV